MGRGIEKQVMHGRKACMAWWHVDTVGCLRPSLGAGVAAELPTHSSS
eukprot:COSAG06_NODE_66628_length_254_cov_0.503226_1_plen_46_part_01